MGIVFSCCIDFRDPSTENSPGNDCCFSTVLQKCKQMMDRNDFQSIRSDTTSTSISETPTPTREVSNDGNYHRVQPHTVPSGLQSSQSHVEVSVPYNTREGEGVLRRKTERMPTSNSASIARVRSSEPNGAGIVPERSREGDNVRGRQTAGTSGIALLIPEKTGVCEGMSSSSGASNSRVTEQHVTVPDNNRAGGQQAPSNWSSLCSEKQSLPKYYHDLFEELLSPDEEDVCPTCLEDYDPENPKIITECFHHFHLSCIYAWMERSNTCPICFRVMVFDEAA